MANERRLKILKILSKEKDCTVGDISDFMNFSIQSTSKHLLKLEDAELAERKQISSNVFYYLNKKLPEEIKPILRNIP